MTVRARRPRRTGVGAVLLVISSLAGLAACSSGSEPSGGATGTRARGTVSTTTAPGATVTVAPAVRPQGSVSHGTLTVDGRERTYRLYVPAALPDGPVPLFVGLHGGTGWGDQFATTDHIEGLAESNDFIVVHPDGVRVTGMRGQVWNGGVCCGVAAREDVGDVAFLSALIDAVERDHDIDRDRVFAFGHSNGGIMSYRVACELADRIVGIGVVAGTLGVEPCRPSRPVSVIHVHGTADENLPLAGGIGSASIAAVDFPPPRDGFDELARRDGCPARERTVAGDITSEVRAPCREGTAAVFVTITSAPHVWPGGTPVIEPASGAGYARFDATTELVSFLLSHPRR